MKRPGHNSDEEAGVGVLGRVSGWGANGIGRSLMLGEIPFAMLAATTVVLIILIRTIGSVTKSVARERTRREIAAYIAEGSMSPEQGERLMKAGKESAEG